MFVVGCYELFQHESHHQLLLVFVLPGEVFCPYNFQVFFFRYAAKLLNYLSRSQVKLIFFHTAKTKSKFDLFLIPKEFVLAYNDDWMCG